MHRVAAPLPLACLIACQPPGAPKEAAPATPVPAPAAAPPAPAPTPPPPADAALPADAAPIADAAPADRPMYYDRPITSADLEGRTLRELNLLRNTIYARSGQRFRKAWLSDYFAAQPWYTPVDKAHETALSELDLRNAEVIVDFEAKIGADQLRARRDALNERMRAEAATPEDAIEFQIIAAKLGEWEGGDEIPAEKRSPLEDPDRLDRLLTVDMLADLSLRDLRLLRNTIYARRGRPFRSWLLQEHFGAMAWYQADEGYSDAKLTAIDRKNIRLIKSVEAENGGPLTDWGHKVEEGWFYAA